MSLPSVDVSVQDGALGAVNTGNPMLVVIAPATAGSLNTPAAYATTRGIVTAFGSGTLVEAACYAIDQLGQPVITIRSAGSTAAAASNLVVAKDVGSTSVPTLASSPTSDDDYEGLITITTGGTIGTAGIRYTTSLDKGRTTRTHPEPGHRDLDRPGWGHHQLRGRHPHRGRYGELHNRESPGQRERCYRGAHGSQGQQEPALGTRPHHEPGGCHDDHGD